MGEKDFFEQSKSILLNIPNKPSIDHEFISTGKILNEFITWTVEIVLYAILVQSSEVLELMLSFDYVFRERLRILVDDKSRNLPKCKKCE